MEYKTIGELCTVKGGKRLPKGEVLVDYKTKHPYVRISDFNHDSIDKKKVKYLTDDVYEKIKNYIINTGDIFLSIVGTIGLVDIINEDLDFSNLTENAVKISSNDNRFLLTEYLYYYLKSPQGQHEINIRTVGSTQPKLAIKRIRDIPIPIVNISEQQTIVSILKNIDGKMKVNQEIIANLEELSQTLFKRWFIDFEFPDENGKPYKSNNGHMIESDFGPIPVNFKIGKIEDICELKYGKALPKAKRIAGKYPVYGSGGVTGTHNDFLVSGPGIIIGRKGTIGSIYIEFNDFFPIDTVFYIQSELYSINFLYQLFQSLNFKDSNNDSAVPGLNRNFVYQTQIVIPNSFIANEFDSLIEPLSSLISIKLKENNELVILRDTLLSKLMSGEIELPDELEVDEHAELLQ